MRSIFVILIWLEAIRNAAVTALSSERSRTGTFTRRRHTTSINRSGHIKHCVSSSSSYSSSSSSSKYAIMNPPQPVSWSNRLGLTLTPIATGVWAAERPFIWNRIDVGGRSVIMRMADGSLCVHSPVQWTPELGLMLSQLGPVQYVISPNYEHLKYAEQWATQYPEAKMLACPGLPQRMPQVQWYEELFSSSSSDVTSNAATATAAVSCIADTIESVHFDCELNPFTGRPFFNEVVFFHKPSRTLITSDMFWNYPAQEVPNYAEQMRAEGSYALHQCSKVPSTASAIATTADAAAGNNVESESQQEQLLPPAIRVPVGTKLWKFGMDRVYVPFFQRFMVGHSSGNGCNNEQQQQQQQRRQRYDAAVRRVLDWQPRVIAPCHGDVIRGQRTCKAALENFFLIQR